jgi:tRNA nucleotidyltransferase (CCA-adding enzyme)
MQNNQFDIPKEVVAVSDVLLDNHYKAHLVGGCVRDLLLGCTPNDWDIATNAKPEEVQKLFSSFAYASADRPATVYENQFGTVGVKTDSDNPSLKVIEITTYRIEGKYSDKRHPDSIRFAKTIEDDLSRRDFTINAIAYDLDEEELVDPYGGQDDLTKEIIRTVGEPKDRFNEDALRLLRAVRFSAQLGFEIHNDTMRAIEVHAHLLEFIAKERIRDEFSKLLMTNQGHEGVRLLFSLKLLPIILPELLEGVDVSQNKHHVFDVFEHSVRSLAYAVEQKFALEIRLAALLHDVGKPKSKRGEGENSTFYGHQVVGERMALKALDRLRYSKDIIELVALLVREHMFVYDPDAVTEAGVRRLVRRVGKENVDDLIKLREADRIGSGVPKAQPYRLRHLKAIIEKVSQDPIHPKMLKVKGDDVMKLLNIEPGPKIGMILAVLLEEVLDNPSLNDVEVLEKRVRELGEQSEEELIAIAERARASALKVQDRIDEEIKKKYFVK